MAAQSQWHPSKNFGERKNAAKPSLIVLHYTAMTSTDAALQRLCDPAHEVSAHYLISNEGYTWQLVAETRRAWHAGAGLWGDVSDVNSHSIGIELTNAGDHPFAAPQMLALEILLRDVMERWSIPPQAVIAHSDFAIGRKRDPGPRFDWRRLAQQGLSVWPEPADAGNFFVDARAFGYRLPDCGQTAKAAFLQAFRSRFRPMAQGPLDAEDARLAAGLKKLA